MQTIEDVQDITARIRHWIGCVNDQWSNLDDDAQECWENFIAGLQEEIG
jgi:hypothetical protein